MKILFVLLATLCSLNAQLNIGNPFYVVASLKPAAGGSSMPFVTGSFGTNASAASWQFTNTIQFGTKLTLVALTEFGGVHTSVALTNHVTHAGDGAATLLTRTNCQSGSDFISVWYLNNCPTGQVEITSVSAGNRFPTAFVVGVAGNNDSPFNSSSTRDYLGTDRPGITNTVSSAVNELTFGVISSALFELATTITDTAAGQAAVGKFFMAGGDFDIAVSTNAGAATTTIGYISSVSKPQSLVIISVKP